ncbi:MAG TPA: lysophospholipase [bacterium]|nr:lysophospholipase [bacterium]
MDKTHPKYNEDYERLRGDAPAGDGMWEYFTCGDGAKLFVQYWLPRDSGPERVAVCFHGMCAHGMYYGMFADELVPAGTAVYCADYRGHGLSDGDRGDVTDPMRVIEDMKAFILWVKERHPGAKIFTIGESMGGIINANLMMDPPCGIAGMVLCAPAIWFNMGGSPWKFALLVPAGIIARIAFPGKKIIKTTGDEERGMKDPANLAYDKNDPLHLAYVSPRYILSIFSLMLRCRKSGSRDIKMPVLIFQGGKDIAVSAPATREFYEKLEVEDKEMIYYPDAFHCMTTDPDAPGMLSRIREWMEAR